ncbi:MAG: acylphosphatase [Acidobacteriota bacterium]
MKATRLLISGIVQGVGFRFFAERVARQHGISGYVRNLSDGRVEAVAAGPPERLRPFIERLRMGPAGAKVDVVETQEIDAGDDLRGFDIRF